MRALRRVPQGVLDQDAPDLVHALLVGEHFRRSVRVELERAATRLGDRAELLADDPGGRQRGRRPVLHLELAGVESREVEKIGRKPRQAIDLAAHLPEEVPAHVGVEVFVVEKLEKSAQREERGAQLVGRVGDELAAGPVEGGKPNPHRVERAGELPDLVRMRVDDRGLEVAPAASRSAALSSRGCGA